MAVKIKTKSGTIDIANDVISTVVGGAATDNYRRSRDGQSQSIKGWRQPDSAA